MSWPSALGVGLLAGVLGALAGGLVMNACVSWYRVSSFEGKSGYAVVAVGLLSGLAALILGIASTRMLSGEGALGFLKALGIAWGLVAALAAIAAGIAWALADIPPTIDGDDLMLQVELRLPVDVTSSPAQGSGESWIELGSVEGRVQRASLRGELRAADARREDGRWIVPGEVHLFTRRGQRSITFRLNDAVVQGFQVPLPGNPGSSFLAWSDWGPRPPASAPPWPDSKPSFRFRVQRIERPPPGPTAEQMAADESADEDARFEAMEPGAPVIEWIPWTRDGVTEEHRQEAYTHIAWRGTLVAELAPLIASEDPAVVNEALRLIANLPVLPDGLAEPVAAAGRALAARLRQVNETSPEDDPSCEGAAEVAVRFSAWMSAVRALREHGGDFTPELGELLELSRVHTDSSVMRGDVLRVASYWMHEWAGVEPLSTDPSPK